MRIAKVADRTGVATRMLRYYEDQDLLRPSRLPNGYRDYSDADVERVATIRDLGRAGVPTRFIKIVLDRQDGTTTWTATCDDILAGLVRAQVAEIDARLVSLRATRRSLLGFLQDAGRS